MPRSCSRLWFTEVTTFCTVSVYQPKQEVLVLISYLLNPIGVILFRESTPAGQVAVLQRRVNTSMASLGDLL